MTDEKTPKQGKKMPGWSRTVPVLLTVLVFVYNVHNHGLTAETVFDSAMFFLLWGGLFFLIGLGFRK